MTDQDTKQDGAPLYGIMAEYDTPTAVVKASKKVRDAGYQNWDTYTPFPIHGIEKAMGIKMTKLPWFVITMAMCGLATAIVLQWWTNAVDYKWLISGKPFWSWPANVPIMFELTVLFSAFSTLGGMFFLNNLPLPSHPLDLKERFRRVSDDKFFLLIEAKDPQFDGASVKSLLEETSPVVIDDVLEDRESSDQLPKPLKIGLMVAVVASAIPFVLFAQARVNKTETTPRHLVWDMDFTPSYKAQSDSELFEDGRAMRTPPEGTVAMGQLNADPHLHQGKNADGSWATTLPAGVEPTMETMKEGEINFGIYCTPCHGQAGEGDGMIGQRVQEIGQSWIAASNLHSEHLHVMPAGQIFDAITNGVRNMPSYGKQMDAEERWAVVLYIRALQRTRATPVEQLSADDRAKLK